MTTQNKIATTFGLGLAAPVLPAPDPTDADRRRGPRPNAGTKRVRSRYSH